MKINLYMSETTVASAFRHVQLRLLVPRGHKLNIPKRQRAHLRHIHLMLVEPDQSAPLFCKCVKNVNNLETRG